MMIPHLRLSKLMAFLCCFALFVSGCSKLVPTPEPVTITFMHQDDPSGSYTQWAQAFHELYPHITVELEVISNSNYAQIPTRDAFVATPFDLAQYTGNQAVLDLATFIEQDEDFDTGDFYTGAFDAFASQGRQWGLPSGIDMMVLYYNKDIFDQYSASYPQIGWNWGDFLDLALQTTDPASDLYGYGLHHEGELAVFEPVVMIYQYGGRIFDSLQSPTSATLDDSLNVDAMSFYASLIYDHGVAPSPEDVRRLGSPYPWRGVFEGRFAMWAGMFSDRGGPRWPSPWPMNWGVVPMPRGQEMATLGTAEGLFVSSQSAHPDAAWTWIKYVSEQMPPYMMPARRSLAQSAEFETKAGIEVAEAVRAAMDSTTLVGPDLLGFESTLEAMMEAFVQIRSGQVDPDMALSTAQEKTGY